MVGGTFWRKIGVLMSALVMSCVLVACGGPSKSDAGDYVLNIVEAMFDGNLEPLLDSMKFDMLSEEELNAARGIAEGKLSASVSMIQAEVKMRGGLDNIEVTNVTQQDNLFNVTVKVTYNDGASKTNTSKVVWSEEDDRFWIVN